MELKDLILETINELSNPSFTQESQAPTLQLTDSHYAFNEPSSQLTQTPLVQKSAESLKEECEFLEGLQERLLVLFEGLKAEHNQNIESTLHITIHFLEHQLNVIQERLEILKK